MEDNYGNEEKKRDIDDSSEDLELIGLYLLGLADFHSASLALYGWLNVL